MKIYVYVLMLASFIGTTLLSASAMAGQNTPAQNTQVKNTPAPIQIPSDVKVYKNIEYASVDGSPLLLNLYIPKSEKPLPLIIWIHGGAWAYGSKENPKPIRTKFYEKGYAVASIEYRLSDKAKFPAQIYDCKGAIRFLRANAKKYKLDASHFGVWGESAGGHLVAMLGTTNGNKLLEGTTGGNLNQSSNVQAVCDYYGPADLTRIREHDLADPNASVSKLLGETVIKNRDKAVKASPITYVTKNSVPFLIVHGTEDKLVDVSQSESLYNALKKANAQADLKIIQGAGHGGPAFMDDNAASVVQAFFDKHLKK